MTDKCRRKMNGREEYITTEITQRKGGRGDGQEEDGGPEKGRRLLCDREGLGIPVLEREVPFFLETLGHPILCVFYPQNKSSLYQSPTFRPTIYKFIVIDSIRKS